MCGRKFLGNAFPLTLTLSPEYRGEGTEGTQTAIDAIIVPIATAVKNALFLGVCGTEAEKSLKNLSLSLEKERKKTGKKTQNLPLEMAKIAENAGNNR